jgi:hypothetical protein
VGHKNLSAVAATGGNSHCEVGFYLCDFLKEEPFNGLKKDFAIQKNTNLDTP